MMPGKLPNLLKNEVHIWFGNIPSREKLIPKYYDLLSPAEKIKANKFKFAENKRQFMCCRGLLRFLSGHYLSTIPKSINFKYGEYGKPYFDCATALKFNVSHSGYYGIIGFVLNSEIGVDVEEIKFNVDVLEIAHNFFSASEITALKKIDGSEKNEAFYRCWTRKEAFIKAKSKGLSFPLDSFSVSLDSDISAELLETKWNTEEKKQWKLNSFKPSEKYLAAMSVNKSIETVHYYNWNNLF